MNRYLITFCLAISTYGLLAMVPSRQERWVAPASAARLTNPYTIEPLTLPLGEELYGAHCSSCHNDAPSFMSSLPEQTEGSLFWKISEGRNKMPGYKSELSAEQRWQITEYLRDAGKPYNDRQNPFRGVPEPGQAVVRKTTDFELDGKGSAANWNNTEWLPVTLQESADDRPISRKTNVKLLYSDNGLYCLFNSEDEKITATIREDFGALFREDVVEIFLWPDPSVPVYFEYELSPLNYELAYLVPNIGGKFQGWRPARYEGKIRTRHATSVNTAAADTKVVNWTAEVFIPYALLNPLVRESPKAGTRWRANFYRIDYDEGYTSWSWQKTTPKVRGSLHEFNKFGTLIFE